jgi:ribosomal protein S24E
MIEMLSDENNSFLSRREIICDFNGLGGKLKKLEAIEMITKEFKLDGKIVIPIKLQNHAGQPKITGTFYVYDDEKLAKEQVNSVIFARLDKAKNSGDNKKVGDAEPAKTDAEPAKTDAEPTKTDAEPAKTDAPTNKSDTKTNEKGENN